jgi:hypothetical protein
MVRAFFPPYCSYTNPLAGSLKQDRTDNDKLKNEKKDFIK